MRIAIFAYNFPHKKTQDFLIKLFLKNIPVSVVLATNPVKLNIPAGKLRTSIRYQDLYHPKDLCDRFGIPYHVASHNSPEALQILSEYDIDLAVIAGARILAPSTIEAVSGGIINFHPGLIPRVRGLDALKRSIIQDVPVAVTAHFVDKRIDAGRLICVRLVPIFMDDTLVDLSHRINETQVVMLPETIDMVRGRSLKDFEYVSTEPGSYSKPITPEEEAFVEAHFQDYKRKFNQ